METLDEWERQVHSESAEFVTVHLAPRLIAALRDERALVERLEGELAVMRRAFSSVIEPTTTK